MPTNRSHIIFIKLSGYKNPEFWSLKNISCMQPLLVVLVCTFDENLLEHISHELADNGGRESDTS